MISARDCLCASAVGILVLALAFPATADDLADSENLFFIKRSKNANEVHYDARVSDCTWNQPAIDSYWRDLKVGPSVYSEIQIWEHSAYGFDVVRLSDTEIKLVLRAIPSKNVLSRLSRTDGGGCKVATTIEIDDATADFRAVYVFATENLVGWPTVHYIDILGIRQGSQVFERVVVSKKGRTMGPATPDSSHWKSGAPTWGRPK